MNLILNIDTAVQTASIALSAGEKVISVKTNPAQKDHAAWLHLAIKSLLEEQQLSLSRLNAVAISAGPGSYTGLRVGMATAKGLCYALHIPLITINTLQMMTVAALNEPADLLCPMIDARRQEVFTAIYDKALNQVLPSQNYILTTTSFGELLHSHTIVFFGNGSHKFRQLIHHPRAVFSGVEATAAQLAFLSNKSFQQQQFADLAYCEPFYGKEFYSPSPKKIL